MSFQRTAQYSTPYSQTANTTADAPSTPAAPSTDPLTPRAFPAEFELVVAWLLLPDVAAAEDVDSFVTSDDVVGTDTVDVTSFEDVVV